MRFNVVAFVITVIFFIVAISLLIYDPMIFISIVFIGSVIALYFVIHTLIKDSIR